MKVLYERYAIKNRFQANELILVQPTIRQRRPILRQEEAFKLKKILSGKSYLYTKIYSQ